MRVTGLSLPLLAVVLMSGCVSVPDSISKAAHTKTAHAKTGIPFDFAMRHFLLGRSEKNRKPSSAMLHHDYQLLLTTYHSQLDFSCLQPAWAAWFQAQAVQTADQVTLGAARETMPVMDCPERLPLLLRDSQQGWQVRWLNPKQVQSIHLLFAGKSPAMASRFGHVALRLVICPDEARVRLASCDNQVEEQLVLGFQAYVDDSKISLRRAVLGGYRSRLVVQPFMEVYAQYTDAEFRQLSSLPLRMSADEQQAFLESLVHMHWTHESDYRFFGNNCATLLQDALATFWPRYQHTESLQKRYQRPDRFFQALQTSDLVDRSLLNDKVQARQKGYFFASNEAAYRQAAALLRASMQQPFFTSLDDYLAVPAVKRRVAIEHDAGLITNKQKDAHLQPVPLILEEWAMLRAERRVLQASSTLWELKKGQLHYKGNGLLSAEEDRLLQDCLLTPLQNQLAPPELQTGIPAKGIVEGMRYLPCDAAQKKALKQFVQKEWQQAESGWQPLLRAIHELTETMATVQAWQERDLAAMMRESEKNDAI